jgi:hypothetical protein
MNSSIPRKRQAGKALAEYIILGLLFVSACSCPKPIMVTNPPGPRVESWVLVEVDDLNARIGAAVEAGETWPQDPVLVVRELLFAGFWGWHVSILKDNNRLENPDSTVITITRDGFDDDSIRGDWHRISLHRLPDATWRVDEVRRAFRCYRGRQLDTYGSDLCP